ncbi:MAG: hypothetical protein P8173_18175, partial [Gammaproteobacteria bacterium]
TSSAPGSFHRTISQNMPCGTLPLEDTPHSVAVPFESAIESQEASTGLSRKDHISVTDSGKRTFKPGQVLCLA